MKSNISNVLVAVVLCGAIHATGQTVQYVTVVNTNASNAVSYPLQTNQVVSIVGTYDSDSVRTVTVWGRFPDGTHLVLPPPGSGPFQMFTGLTNVFVLADGAPGATLCATFQITTPATVNVISNYVPADAIVIPASATGNVQIILESSTDLVNWTAASPGT